jgi:hypothetical protein
MSDPFLLRAAQMRRIALFFPLSHGVRRVVSGIVSVIRHGLWWKDARRGSGPRPACSKRGISPLHRPHQGWVEFQAARHRRRSRAAD